LPNNGQSSPCQKVACPQSKLPKISHGKAPNNVGGALSNLKFGDKVTYTCNPGYTGGSASITVQCNKDAGFSAVGAKECLPVKCNVPSYTGATIHDVVLLRYGHSDASRLATSGVGAANLTARHLLQHAGSVEVAPATSEVTFGKKVTFRCTEKGYAFFGDPEKKTLASTCAASGDLDFGSDIEFDPECDKVKCTLPVQPGTKEGSKTKEMQYEDKVTFTCKEGYILGGGLTGGTTYDVTCAATGKPSGTLGNKAGGPPDGRKCEQKPCYPGCSNKGEAFPHF